MTDQVVLGYRASNELANPDRDFRSQVLAKKGDPVTVSRELLKKSHFFCRGTSGSGKTSISLGPMAKSLMEPYTKERIGANGEVEFLEDKDSIFVFDNGGDIAFFNSVRERAELLGRKFRFVSLNPRKSFRFDPLQSLSPDSHRVIRFCNLMLEALNLDFGLQYGASYYSARNIAQLLTIIDQVVERKRQGKSVSLKEIVILLERNQLRDAEQILMAFNSVYMITQEP